MYAVVRRYEGVRDSKKVAQLAEEGFVPIISEMPGFVAYYLELAPIGGQLFAHGNPSKGCTAF
jgi:hypothetical protein